MFSRFRIDYEGFYNRIQYVKLWDIMARFIRFEFEYKDNTDISEYEIETIKNIFSCIHQDINIETIKCLSIIDQHLYIDTQQQIFHVFHWQYPGVRYTRYRND